MDNNQCAEGLPTSVDWLPKERQWRTLGATVKDDDDEDGRRANEGKTWVSK